MHRRTIRSFAALATVAALSDTGLGSVAMAATAHHPPSNTVATTTTKIPTHGVVRVVRGSAPGKGPEADPLCQNYAGLIDEALDGQQRDTIANDDAGAHEWHQLANEIAHGGVAQGVVYLLEPVQIAHQDSDLRRFASRARQFSLEMQE